MTFRNRENGVASKPSATLVEDIFRHSFHTEKIAAGTHGAYPDAATTKREIDRIRRYLGVTDRQLIRMVNISSEAHGRAWFAPRVNRRPSVQYLIRMVHLVFLKMEGRLDIEHGWVLDFAGKPKWPLVSHVIHKDGEPLLDSEGRAVLERSYWETTWLAGAASSNGHHNRGATLQVQPPQQTHSPLADVQHEPELR